MGLAEWFGLSAFSTKRLLPHHGYLSVNTRCIYYQVKPSRSDPDNLTMCPILDFANHTSSSKHMSPVPLDARAWNSHQKYSRDLAFLSPRGCLQENEEVYLCYGAHANRTLFVEYGFVNALPKNPSSSDDFNGEIDVQDIVEHLFEEKGEEGSWMREVLEDRGYWGYVTGSPLGCFPEANIFYLALGTGLFMHVLDRHIPRFVLSRL